MNSSSQEFSHLQMGEEQIQLLERLSNACAVSGDEGEVRRIVLEQVRAVLQNRPGEVKVDSLGNVLVTLPGEGPQRLKVMVAAHMDEVGFMIIKDEDKGYYRFDVVGGIDIRLLPGKPVWIGPEHLVGLIGAKAIHLTQPDELKKPIQLDNLRIDAGPNASKVKIGDRATFATTFTRLGPSLRGKALDNRLGVATLIELIKHAPANIDLLAAFTVQEEVGLRGARVAAYALEPDLAIALDSTPAFDLPQQDDSGDEKPQNHVYNTRLDLGPAIYLADSGTISDPRLVGWLAGTGEKYGIPFQFRQPGGGGTDAGAIHRTRSGVPAISLSVPSRYQHSAVSIARLTDWQNTLRLLVAALSDLNPSVLSTER